MAPKTATKKTPFDAQLEELRKQHGAIVHFVAEGKLFVFRPPTLEEFEDSNQRVRKGDPIGVVNREVALQTLVVGTPEALNELFAKAPALPTMIGDGLGDLAQGGIEVVVKKD